MSRRAVLAAAALLVGGVAGPALAGPVDTARSLGDGSHVCVLTHYDPQTGEREGVCVWVPVRPPGGAAQATR